MSEKRDYTILCENLEHGVMWADLDRHEKWVLYSLQSSDYLYHTRFIERVGLPDGHTMFKALDIGALRKHLKVQR